MNKLAAYYDECLRREANGEVLDAAEVHREVARICTEIHERDESCYVNPRLVERKNQS